MARRRRPGVGDGGIALWLALASLAGGATAHAQDLSSVAGTFQVSTDQTTVQIPEWGTDCGPRPASHTGSSGRQASVTVDGTQVLVQDGRRRTRTDGCWSDNPAVHRISSSHSGSTYTVLCQTADADYQHERGTYTITVDADRITMHESTEYSWQLRESRCQATATRTLTYQRVGERPTPAASVDAGPPTVATPTNPTPPPVRRCATPGPGVSMVLAPARRSLAPGGRTCFAVRVLDANGCAVPRDASAPPLAWQMSRTNGAASGSDAVMENGCVRAPSGSVATTYGITATAGALVARGVAAVVSAEELQQLVAQHIEDEDTDAGVVPPVVGASGAGVGASSVVTQTSPTAESGGIRALTIGVLVACGVLLAVGGWLLLRKRAPVERVSDPGRSRRSAVPIPPQELARSALAAAAQATPSLVAPTASPNARTVELRPPVAAVPDVRPLVKRCPQCDQRFTAEIAFCPEHGMALVDVTAGAPTVAAVVPAPVAPRVESAVPTAETAAARTRVCPVCQRRFGAQVAFCGDDGTPLIDS